MKKERIKQFLFLHIALLVYSLTSILSKFAADKKGIVFIMMYGGVLVCLALYAILWQVVLKKFSLTIAFANKAIVVVWGIVWGWLFFEEAVTWNKIIGAIIIIVGIMMVVRDDE